MSTRLEIPLAGEPNFRSYAWRTMPLLDRIFDRIILNEANCWLWTGPQVDGYGVIRNSGRQLRVHRVTFEYFIGEIPSELELDHLCRIRSCVNPWHCEAVTSLENWQRGKTPSRLNALKTHCVRGHEFSQENTLFYKARIRGKSYTLRVCRTCKREQNRERRAKEHQ